MSVPAGVMIGVLVIGPRGLARPLLHRPAREPRTAWLREVPLALACGQRHENVGQDGVRAEPRHQAVKAIAASSTTAPAFDAHDVQGKFAKRS